MVVLYNIAWLTAANQVFVILQLCTDIDGQIHNYNFSIMIDATCLLYYSYSLFILTFMIIF